MRIIHNNNNLLPRTRRPYDLRRKVLLKNFLKEQLTYIPSARDKSLDLTTETNGSDNSPSGNEENLTQSCEVQDNSISSTSEILSAAGTSTFNEKENDNEVKDSLVKEEDKSSNTSESNTSLFPKFSKLASVLRLGVSNKKNRIGKLKQSSNTLKMNKRVLRNSSVSTKDDESPKARKKSLFDVFKSKRASKRGKPVRFRKPSECSDDSLLSTCCKSDNTSTTNQSVQTDISWTQETLQNMQQSNQCLIEENRLLSESLNNIMTGINFTFEKCGKKPSVCTDLYTSVESIRDKSTDSTTSRDNLHHSNTKVLRSKSIQEKTEIPNRILPLRSRSLNRGTSGRSFYSNDRFSNRTSKVLPHLRPVVSSLQHSERQALHSLPINPHGRPILRRLSMPERPPRRTEQLRLRPRSNSIRANDCSSYRTGNRLANYPYHSRPKQESSFSHNVPFRNMPSHAFY